MDDNKTHIKDYENLIREIVSPFINKASTDAEKRNQMFLTSLKKLLCFSKEEDWSILTSSLDLIGDTILAIENFQHFGLEGPTKYNDYGERYLRLYGALNAAYLLKSSLIQLCTIFSLQNKKSLVEKINNSKIIELRNIAGSHTVNFNDKSNKTKYFKVARFSIFHDEVIQIFDERNTVTEHNIRNLMEEFLELVTETMDLIVDKAISTIYKDNSKIKIKLNNELGIVRKRRQGHIIIKIPSFPD